MFTENPPKKVLDPVRGRDYCRIRVRCEAHRGDAREPGRTSPQGTDGGRKEAGGSGRGPERRRAERRACPGRARWEGWEARRCCRLLPLEPSARANTDRVYAQKPRE